ncbi:MAG: TSUP family transporter, partial [Deltaproteobacteria bacterium]|nr:TSUP family transporter [Deltaproteobacteria bacterium]
TVAVVPLHGAVQLAAGGSRVFGFRKHIRWDVAVPFMAGLLPGSLVGIGAVAWLAAISPSVLKALIAVTILLSLTVRPKTRPTAYALVGGGEVEAAHAGTRHRLLFVSVGMLVGVLGIIVGAAGSIVTQALLTAGVVKEEHIATKSTIQATSNLIKVPLFGFALSFDYAEYALPLAVMMVAVVVGTFLGKRLLGMLSSQRFVFLARALLFLVAMQMLVAEAARALDLV